MLSAIPSRSEPLGLFRLVLELVAQDDHTVPSALQEHFLAILIEARNLNQRSGRDFSVRHPESVNLALEMSRDEHLAESLNGIFEFSAVSRERAKKVLHELERHPAY